MPGPAAIGRPVGPARHYPPTLSPDTDRRARDRGNRLPLARQALLAFRREDEAVWQDPRTAYLPSITVSLRSFVPEADRRNIASVLSSEKVMRWGLTVQLV